MTGHFGQKSGLAKSRFLFYSTVVSHIFVIFGNYEQNFLPISGFSRNTTQIQGLSRAWKCFPPIPGLSRIFKDLGNRGTYTGKERSAVTYPKALVSFLVPTALSLLILIKKFHINYYSIFILTTQTTLLLTTLQSFQMFTTKHLERL